MITGDTEIKGRKLKDIAPEMILYLYDNDFLPPDVKRYAESKFDVVIKRPD